MKYELTVFGVKDMTENVAAFIHENLRPVDLVITIGAAVTAKNHVAGFTSLGGLTEKYGIPVFEADSYPLTDEKTKRLFADNEFSLGLSLGWQRLVPKAVLDAFPYGVFGFHGNSGYLPFGRGRSPLNWSLLLGDTRFNLNLFRYDEKADSPNVFATQMFSLTPHDNIRTAQYKHMICAKQLLVELLSVYALAVENDMELPIRTESKDFDSWYTKRTAADGKIDFRQRTREIYNLIRAVAAPFPGAWTMVGEDKLVVWEAHPFDEIMDFSAYAPGEVVDIFDGNLVVRTVDGSLLIEEYECEREIEVGDVLGS
ncbi:MAG: hypothetical protein LBI54_02920 [Lachnospiraceae bacterium]|jgi:UDP-4-amino-4-deoxy-L-arabinose formyltransferase/UDP-glucuronic acid dehydrogenase (UDP-4-keto-hexauronic acid decarboxylating)|nr:hypothetical protein [Lachnospiraceae bacterium]